MSILERIKFITDNYSDGDIIKVLYNLGDSSTVYVSDGNIGDMETYAKQFKEEGKITGKTPEGYIITVVDFKLIK